jgi:hypothetical protein
VTITTGTYSRWIGASIGVALSYVFLSEVWDCANESARTKRAIRMSDHDKRAINILPFAGKVPMAESHRSKRDTLNAQRRFGRDFG